MVVEILLVQEKLTYTALDFDYGQVITIGNESSFYLKQKHMLYCYIIVLSL